MRSNTTDEPKTRIGVIIDNDILTAFRVKVQEDKQSLSSVVNQLMGKHVGIKRKAKGE